MKPKRSFLKELIKKTGGPIFSASLVACLLAGKFEWLHGFFIGLGIFFLYLDYKFF